MTISCTRCNSTGFLEFEQLHEFCSDDVLNKEPEDILIYILSLTESGISHDISVCDCCGDGESWYDVPGEHYNNEDPPGDKGPYADNGGLCRCH